MFHLFIFVFITSFCVLFIGRKVAKRIGLVDKPNSRKLHLGEVPLIGGLSICITIVISLSLFEHNFVEPAYFLGSISILALLGAIDDKYDISFKFRMMVQAVLSLVMIYFAGLELNYLGNMFGFGGNIVLGGFAIIITILAVIGAINAFNMVDGIDGLLGGLSIVTFGGLAFLLNDRGHHDLTLVCIIFIIASLPYIMMNLGLLGRKRKVFMGDAGSMMIGFTVIWLLLSASQNAHESPLIRPVTALWLIALPLMDMTAIMIRRIRRGHSPFKPDREHLHHICQRFGLSSRQTLVAICALASAMTGFGIYGEVTKIPEPIMFYSFIACFIGYALCLSYVWRITSFFRAREALNKQSV